MEPPAEGLDWLPYVMPPFVLVLSAGLTAVLLRGFVLRRSSAGDIVGRGLSAPDVERNNRC